MQRRKKYHRPPSGGDILLFGIRRRLHAKMPKIMNTHSAMPRFLAPETTSSGLLFLRARVQGGNQSSESTDVVVPGKYVS